MDDKNQKERLEQELRFLKESFEAEVISKEEFEKGKDRIEKKLKGIGNTEKEQVNEETKKEQIEAPPKPEESKEEPKVVQVEEYFEASEKVSEKKPFKENQKSAEKPKSKIFKYAIVFVVLVLVVFFSYSLLSKKNTQETQPKFASACISDNDCKKAGNEGLCLEPGTKDAKCEFREIPKTNVVVLNDRKNCFNCDTRRILSILEGWFGQLNSKEIDYNIEEGKRITGKLDAKMLPVYILDENITTQPNFEKFRQAFAKIGDNYVLKDDAAGSAFYVKRENIQNKLDLFVVPGDDASLKAENNLKEFLAIFDNIKFEKHFQNDNLTKELNIKSFPTFLVNNVDKFSGVLAPETIKENFCKVNKLPECNESLSKSLV